MIAAIASATLDPAFHVEKTESGSEVISQVGSSNVSSSSTEAAPSSSSSSSSTVATSSSSSSSSSNTTQPPKVYKKSLLSLEERIALITSIGEEVVQVSILI